MNRKLGARELLIGLALLYVMLSAVFKAQTVEANGTIYIGPDGSINPPTPLIQRNGDSYILTGNIASDANGIVVQRSNMTLDGAAHTIEGSRTYESKGVDLSYTSNVTVKNTVIRGFYNGVFLSNSTSCSVLKNSISNTTIGVSFLEETRDNVISNNELTNCFESINIAFEAHKDSMVNNSILANTIESTRARAGIRIKASNNVISYNKINNYDGFGIQVEVGGNNNVISYNNISGCNYGLAIFGVSGNKIYHNNFLNNTHQVSSVDSTNVWDDGYPSGGNYWSDYNGADADHDGFGDSPYDIDANNTDHYPLMNIIPEFPQFLILPLSMVATLLAVILYKKKERS